ncbi:MAG: beta-galactosidase, partial [Bacteroidales bacterium]|nr:beta-galactosidase [Bacteroidales bacterium]
MKTKSLTILLAAVGTLLTLGLSAQPVSRTLFNDGWTFTKDGVSRVLDLPHDWGVEGDFDISYPSESGKLAWWGKAEYSKTLKVEGKGSRQYFLDIDGAMQWAKVFCNGEYVTEWPYGYASWQADLTPFIKEGDNEIKVTIDNPEESSRWYPGGGIYRNVWLTVADPVGVAHWGTFVTTEGEKVNFEVTLRNAGDAVGGKVRTEIFEYDGRKAVASAETVVDTIRDGIVVNEEFLLKRARRWSPEEPNLYKAVTTVTAGDSKDEYVTVFGLRDLEYKEDGLYINSEKTFLKGVCLHHDAGALGAAWNTTAWTRRLLMLKEMGCNAIRTSHNPPAPELLELCDRMGFVVLDEFSDTWSIPKRKNGYAVLFENWFEKDMAALVRRDRNHPSVIMWSIGNEVPEQGYPDKYWIAYRLTEICHELDPTRLTTVGSDNPWASEQDFRNAVDAYGFNYKPHLYAKFHEANPGKVYYGSETESTISSRGVYMFPLGTTVEAAEQDFQVCSYDLHTVPWGQIPEQEWKFEDENPACLGEFVWTGYDYLGEPTPYNSDLTILSNFHDPKSLERAKKELEEKGRISSPSRSSYFG